MIYLTFEDPENAGVDSIIDIVPEIFEVYGLSGIKMLTTRNQHDIYRLPKGIYILVSQGKKQKIMIK